MIRNMRVDRSNLAAELKAATIRADYAANDLERVQANCARALRERDEARAALSKLELSMGDLTQQVDVAGQTIKKLEDDMTVEKIAKEKLLRDRVDLETEKTALLHKTDKLQTEVLEARSRIEDLRREYDDVVDEWQQKVDAQSREFNVKVVRLEADNDRLKDQLVNAREAAQVCDLPSHVVDETPILFLLSTTT